MQIEGEELENPSLRGTALLYEEVPLARQASLSQAYGQAAWCHWASLYLPCKETVPYCLQ